MKLPQLTYYTLGEGVTAFSSTRHGGASVGNYSTFNINLFCGDDAEVVRVNRIALCEELNIAPERLIVPHQTHGVGLQKVDTAFLTKPQVDRDQLLEGVDGVMTDVSNVCVGVSTADCIPILLYDPIHQSVCAVHAGWRGTAQRIVQRAIAKMHVYYGTESTQLRACIGPGISSDHFEVGDEVYSAFEKAGFEMSTIARRYTKWHIDLWECNRLQLVEVGVCPAQIYVSGICTYERAADYFSARRLGTASGRIYSGILLR